jgi:cytochrome c oxidase subunit 3
MDNSMYDSMWISLHPKFARWFYVYNTNQWHLFHLVTISPWPILAASSILMIAVGLVMLFHSYSGEFLVLLGLLLTLVISYNWWWDVVRESTFLGYHTKIVVRGLRIGMILFIISEIMFFFSFFWAFFHASIAPHISLGAIWPPIGILVLNPLSVPLLNTFILLLSGFFVTVSHYSLCSSGFIFFILPEKFFYRMHIGVYTTTICVLTLLITILLAIEFTFLQYCEYSDAFFCINDGVYGATFYLTTGFHGLHVIIGTIFLSVAFVRLIAGHLLKMHHVGFEASIRYWHFVDVVWLFLYIFVYCWGTGVN